MLSRDENELLTRVGPGTPMGELMRRYWLPALLAQELPEPDCSPVRVRLLGEDLVGFRDTEGRVGLLAERCAHRQASLFYGRNECGGLTCIYHGWKYDVAGHILETPAEPPLSMIKNHVQHTSYPCREVNGLILTYLGPKDRMPLVPNYPWLTLPPSHVRIGSKFFNECNYLQAVEGDCDSAHTDYLHRGNDGKGLVLRRDGAPTFALETRRWGILAVAVRQAPEAQRYIRTNLFVAPCVGCVPVAPIVTGRLDGLNAVHQVPADDHHTWRFDVLVRYSAPFDPADRIPDRDEVGPGFRKLASRMNDYLIDRQKQRAELYSGITFGNHTQDACVTETMGAISDRTQEHLGASDSQIVALRHFLLKAVRDFEQGMDPPGLAWDPAQNDFDDVRCTMGTIPASASWKDLLPVEASPPR